MLTLAQFVPPPIVGSPEEREEQIRKLDYLAVRVVGRYGFTRDRLVELIAILQENLEKHDAKASEEEAG